MRAVPGRKWYAIAGLILVIGLTVCGGFLFVQIRALSEAMEQVVVPGTHELELEEPGGYTIFHEAESSVDGRVYRVGDISGLTVSVESVATGETVEVTTPWTSSSYDLGGRSGRSVLAFHIDEPGTYRLTAGYDAGVDGSDTVLAVGRGFGRKLVITIVGVIVLALASGFLALGIAVYTFVRRYRAGQRARQSLPLGSGVSPGSPPPIIRSAGTPPVVPPRAP